MKRWDEVGRLRKGWRWITNKPMYLLVYPWTLVIWLLMGLPVEKPYRNKREKMAGIWTQLNSMCEYAMGRYQTTEEILEELKHE